LACKSHALCPDGCDAVCFPVQVYRRSMRLLPSDPHGVEPESSAQRRPGESVYIYHKGML